MKERIEQLGRVWIEFNYRKIIPIEHCNDQHLIEYILNPETIYDFLEIKFIDDIAGHGLFAKQDIAKDTVIGILTGHIITDATDREASHSGQTLKTEADYSIIDSHHGGNQTHYIQHLPSQTALEKYCGHLDNEEIATSNLLAFDVETMDGFVLTYFKTARQISAGEIMGCPYETATGEQTMDGLYFFTKQGSICDISQSIVQIYRRHF